MAEGNKGSLQNDIIAYIPAKLIPAFSGIASIWLLTKILKGNGYIDYSFVMALVVIGFQVVNGWLNSSIIYLSQQFRQQYFFFRNAVLSIQVYLLILVSAVVFVLAYFGLYNVFASVLTCLILCAQMLQAYFFSFFQVERKIISQTKAAAIQSVAQLGFLALCYFYFSNSLNAALLAIFVGYMLGNAYSFFFSDFLKGFSPIGFLALTPKKLLVFKKIFAYGIFICFWFFASQFYLVGDRLILKYQHITEGVGGYTAFRDLAIGLAGLLTMPILMASHPEIMRLWHNGKNKNDIESILGFNIRIITILFTPLLLIVYFSGPWITTMLLGNGFEVTGITQFLIVLSIYLSAVSMYIHKGFEVKGNTKPMAVYASITGVFSFVTNLFIAQRFGVTGCAFVAVLSQLLYIGLCLQNTQNGFSFKLHPPFLKRVLLYAAVVVSIVVLASYFLKHMSYFDVAKLILLSVFGIVFILKASEVAVFLEKFKMRRN